MNNVILSGRLVANPEVMTTNDGNCIAKFSLAVDGPIRKNQEKDTDFFNITAFGKRAEFVGQYLKKGTAVIINGRLKSSSYINKDGEKRYSVEVIVNTIEFGVGNNPNRESAPAENYQDEYNQGYSQEYQDNGYDGYDQNYQQGNDYQQNNGYNQGNRAPQHNGYNQGNRAPQNNGYNQGNRVPQDNSNRGYQENNQRNNQSSNTPGYQRGNHGEGNGNNVNQRSQGGGNNQRLDPARAFSPVPTHGGFH